MKNWIYLEGVGYDIDSDTLTINLKNDSDDDLVKTKLQKSNSKLATRSGFGAYVAYWIEPTAKKIPSFDRVLKDKLTTTNDGVQMIKKSVMAFDRLVSISSFDVILYPKSSSKINQIIANFIESKSSANTLNIPDSVVKNSLNNIKVNTDKLNNSSEPVKRRVSQLLNNPSGNFELKKIPMIMRNMFSDFLKFDTDRERELFNKLNGGKVLIIDDVYTRGTTITELARMVYEKGAREVIIFIFLQQR